MEISAPPGTALILEPGGLDAPAQESGEETIAIEAAANDDEADEQQPVEAEEEPSQQNRVIVRRRGTRGGGFFTRKDTVAPNGIVSMPAGHLEAEKERRSRSTVTIVKPSYSSIRSGIIKLTPESMKCKLYCRGAKCIYCNADSWSEEQQAIRGIYSNWIDENLLAMARPTKRSFEDFDLIGQFKKAGIRSLFNLQCVNEHDYCGPPLIPHTGFSYEPEMLMRKKIFYYNFAIPDFGTVPVQSILNIVKVIWFSLRFGRVAIHCHAGLGRTGTLIACFLVWSKALYTSDAIDVVRAARPNSIQSVEQINVVEEFAYHVHKMGTSLPSAFYAANNGISLRQLMANQRQFLPNEEARRFSHIPKLLYMLGDRLLRLVFEPEGVQYAPPCGHHARSCTFGTIRVNWRNAFTAKGKLQVRTVVNLLARCSAFPYEKDQALINQFQQLSLVTVDSLVAELNIAQLVSLLNAFMESIKKPYCSRKSLIEALGHFSPDNPTGPIPPDSDDEGPQIRGNNEDLDLVKQLVNPRGEPDSPKDVIEEGAKETGNDGEERLHQMHPTTSDDGVNVENTTKNTTEIDGSKENEASPSDGNGEEGRDVAVRPDSAFQGALKRHSMSMSKCAVRYGGASLDAENAGNSVESSTVVDAAHEGTSNAEIPKPSEAPQNNGNQSTTEERPATSVTVASSSSAFAATTNSPSLNLDFGTIQFDNHDSHTNKEASLSADWQCIVFYVCNVLSYLTGENYDAVVDLLTFWFTGDSNRDVKQALYCHMRDLFARNMRQQEQQAAEWRRRIQRMPADD